MDLILVALDSLIIILYICFIALISPYIMRFLKNKNSDMFIQLLPIALIIFVSSVAIATIGYEGFKETLFFRLTSILSLSFIVLLSLLLTMKLFWKEQYEKALSKLHALRDKIGQNFSHK